MAPALFFLALATLPAGVRDTTFVVPEGARIVIEHIEGDIHVTGIGGREARVVLDDEEGGVHVRSQGGTITLGARNRGDDADLFVWLPEDANVSVAGHEGDVTVSGLAGGAVAIRTADGDIAIDGVGRAEVATLDGDVAVANAGAVAVNVADGDVEIERVSGNVTIHGIDTDIVVTDADARAVSITAVSGDLWYEGAVYEGGSYSFSTHDGDVTFALPEGTGAQLSVSTFDGEFVPHFPVQFRSGDMRGGEFLVGDGSAAVALKSFDGDILLIRPGARVPDTNQ